ncbi:MAG: alternative ribosome rescue aminoacyl-tRNA hydrolase ArfB [Caldilineaceae bacterium]
MIEITPTLSLDENEITFDFVQASGPGGQNVNKVATAVQLRFDAANSPHLPAAVKARLRSLAGRRMTDAGMLLIEAKQSRSQLQNRQDALDQLIDLIRRATLRPKTRRKTKPSRAAQEARLQAKRRRSQTKRDRRSGVE